MANWRRIGNYQRLPPGVDLAVAARVAGQAGGERGGICEGCTEMTHVLAPHSQRVYAEIWGNGASIEVLVYKEPQPGEDKSDRIHLVITDSDGVQRGWLMNIEDATAIVRGLQAGIERAYEYGIPERPE